MENLTKPNALIELNKNRHGLRIIRKNYKNRAVVKVRGLEDMPITEYRFDNIGLTYNTKYMNWQNLDCCGGWWYSDEDLINQFKNDKKLFADIVASRSQRDIETIKSKIDECSQMKDVITCDRSDETYMMVTLSKPGCVADYIDVDAVLKDYERFGIELDDYDINEIKTLTSHPMNEFANINSNKFSYDFANPDTVGELIFTGMLLGYPLESTVDRLFLHYF